MEIVKKIFQIIIAVLSAVLPFLKLNDEQNLLK